MNVQNNIFLCGEVGKHEPEILNGNTRLFTYGVIVLALVIHHNNSRSLKQTPGANGHMATVPGIFCEYNSKIIVPFYARTLEMSFIFYSSNMSLEYYFSLGIY